MSAAKQLRTFLGFKPFYFYKKTDVLGNYNFEMNFQLLIEVIEEKPFFST